ncbi:CCA tRNA nucleotidyltransferase [Sulfitobacter sp. S190]|uniref:CCA tRNA nucleotidyltransferase n=1 Tax=Sulfitobacter sp. S190 TaxID=2867022 RepID=UPI0021A56AEE|nr:CCA tRNA nucleotidyltransferase [Sulfitobacter sp. S190]
MTDRNTRAVCDALLAKGYEVYFVGGCVRNALLGEPVSDIDISTNAHPDKVMKACEDAGLKTSPTGIGHGTVTVIVRAIGFEVTTFRRDVATDGRRAVVAFATDIADDARRRDFTMNAIYATPEGQIVDPLNGLGDLRARRLRFIEDAATRIREDYLRTLRYFRFHAWYGNPDQGLDTEALSAISANLAGLETLSAERVGTEFRKLLLADDPAPALGAMMQTGVLTVLLPGADARQIGLLVHLESLAGLDRNWITLLVALGGEGVADRLRLSKAQRRDYALIRDAAFDGPGLPEVAYRHGYDIAAQACLLQAVLAETPVDPNRLAHLSSAAAAEFPVASRDVADHYEGRALGARLELMKSAWIKSDFKLTRDELLALPDKA